MSEVLDGVGISCRRCAQTPHLTEVLGCGQPPTREDRDVWGWAPGPDGQPESPLSRVQRGAPAFMKLGFGNLRINWPWCPRWFSALNFPTIAGEQALPFLRRAQKAFTVGGLDGLVKPPWTGALIDGIDLLDILDGERLRRRRENK